MKENFKGKKGITLIALVITIIVLLILAGVTIATLTGENGILSNATRAKDETDEASAREKLALLLMDIKMDAYEYGETPILPDEAMGDFAEYLGEQDEVDSAIYSNGKILVTIDGKEFYVDNNLNIQDITEGEIASDIQVEIVDGACVRFSSANPEEYAKRDGYEISEKIASTGELKIADTGDSGENMVTIYMPNGETGTLDLSDENATVDYWAYKSKQYTFTLTRGNGERDTLNVDVEIPYTPEEYLDITTGENSKFADLKEFMSYYLGYPAIEIEHKHGEPYPYNIVNLAGGIKYDNTDRFAINGITTYIFSEVDTSLYKNGDRQGNERGKDIKTIYVPATVTYISGEYFSGLTESTTIYFEAAGPLDTWEENWNRNCNAKMLWNQ